MSKFCLAEVTLRLTCPEDWGNKESDAALETLVDLKFRECLLVAATRVLRYHPKLDAVSAELAPIIEGDPPPNVLPRDVADAIMDQAERNLLAKEVFVQRSSSSRGTWDTDANDAYEAADALLAERKRRLESK